MEKLTSLNKYRILIPALESEVTLVEISKDQHIPVRTLSNWKRDFLKLGLAGLDRKARTDKGKHRILSLELLEIAKALALEKPPLTISAIHRRMTVLLKKLGQKAPSYETIYSIVKGINPALLLLAHEGRKAYGQKYELIFRRECNTSNQIWQIDHTLLDLYITAQGEDKRPWVTTVIDDFSRAIAGLFISLEAPSAINTALTLRRAIWRKQNPAWEICGIPQILYTDHGSDFMSSHIEKVCLALKIKMINSAVGRPQGRGKIERFFQTLNETLLIDLPGFSVKGKPSTKPVLSLSQLNEIMERFIIEKYNVVPHSATGIPPLKMWSENFLPQLPDSLQLLDLLLLMEIKPRIIQRDGIRFQGMRYIAPTLAGFVGEQIYIRYDPKDLAEIRVYYKDQFLCKAVSARI